MITSTSKGAAAEQIAKNYLEQKGLSFITQNYRCAMGELDLVFKDQKQWVFIEVKNRKNALFGAPVEWVTKAKQRKIILATEHFLANHKIPNNSQMRFDVIGIIDLEPSSIEWVQNAFLVN
jgi:putative endonuclease